MEATSGSNRLGPLARACADAPGTDELLQAAVPLVRELSGAAAVLVVRRQGEGQTAVARAGVPLGEDALPDTLVTDATDQPALLDVPASWGRAGVGAVQARRLPGFADALVLAWTGAPGDAAPAVDLLVAGLARTHATEQLHDLQARVDNAQQLANMGDYDWHIASDTNQWSDQLYRIYGHEPQSFNASYERFLAHIHPDDRERIQGIHQQAYATGEPYQMIERIVRPDGEVRYLSSNGQVVMDEEHVPVRMRGTCVDITDRVLAEHERERTAARFQKLVEASPDAMLVLDGAGEVVQANGRAHELLGGNPQGRLVDEVLPGHGAAAGLGVEALGFDGRACTLDVTVAPIDSADGVGRVALFLRDAGPRLASEAMAASLREVQVRRRQAMEINDNVVQGLTAAVYALEHGNQGASGVYLQRTLASARRMMNDLLDPLEGEDLRPGDLVRSQASTLEGPPVDLAADAGIAPEDVGRRRVLIVDDSDDVRMLIRLKIESRGIGQVVGEAADGEEAVRMASETRPDLVLLDLAMPRKDGLQALPEIRRAVDGVKVVVLSGFDEAAMAEKALAAGALRYVEKGVALTTLTDILEEVFAPAPEVPSR